MRRQYLRQVRPAAGAGKLRLSPGWGYMSMLAGRDCNEQWIRSIAIGLRPGGIGLISATFNMKKRPTNYCTIKHIFPGGSIPSLAETLILMEKYGLDARAIENLSYHYQRSVEQWLKNFETHWERIHAIDPVRFNEKFRRTWLFYLGGRDRNLRGRTRDHQLLPHDIREGTFRAQGPVHTHQRLTVNLSIAL